MVKNTIIVLILSMFLVKNQAIAAIKINELYPAPSTGNTEWIELYNDASESASLVSYTLTDLANNFITIPAGTIPANSFAIATTSGVLNNDGDTAILKDNLNSIVDMVSYTGTFTSTKAYARCYDGGTNWITTTTLTKSSSNAPACAAIITPSPTVSPTLTPAPTVTQTPTPSPTPTPTQTIAPTPQQNYENISLSEVMAYPLSGENEWIELYNDNAFPVTLENWYIDDVENAGASPRVFSLTIPAQSYGTYELSSSIFNNSGDTVRLLDLNKNLINSFRYTNSEQNQTWGKDTKDPIVFCLQMSTPNAANNDCVVSTTPTPTVFLSPTPTAPPTIFQQKQTTTLAITPRLTTFIPAQITREIITQKIKLNSYPDTTTKTLVLGESTRRRPHRELAQHLAIWAAFSSLGCLLKICLKVVYI